MKVVKLGGKVFDSVGFIISLKDFFKEKYKNGEKILFVISAVKGVTRLLHLLFEIKMEKDIDEGFRKSIIDRFLEQFEGIHVDLICNLFGDKQKEPLSHYYADVHAGLKMCIKNYHETDNKDKLYASILKFGELASSQIFYDYLSACDIRCKLFNAPDYIITTDNYRKAEVLEVKPGFATFFNSYNFLVTQGFIASNKFGDSTLLGFDGSDDSAAHFAKALKKNTGGVRLIYCKDVKGFFMKDPSLNPEAAFCKKIYLSIYRKLPTHPIKLSAVETAIESGVTVSMMNFLDIDGQECFIHP